MIKKHREILSQLMSACNSLGGSLDRTATHESKLWDRQRAHMLVSNVLFGVLTDHPDNDCRFDDMRKAIDSLNELNSLVTKTYTDRIGFIKPEEAHLLKNRI
jgi:hypothetical protein